MTAEEITAELAKLDAECEQGIDDPVWTYERTARLVRDALALVALVEHARDAYRDAGEANVKELTAECDRLRALVQCCPRDNDYDGNCRIHSSKGVLRK